MARQFPPLHIVTYGCPMRIARPSEPSVRPAALLQRNNPGGCSIRATPPGRATCERGPPGENQRQRSWG